MVSAIVLTKNEESNIAKCLKSISWCSEIVVIDDYSTDKTLKIVNDYRVKVIQRKLTNFSDQRNYGLRIAKNDWVLFIDADEIVPEELKEEIIEKLKEKNTTNGFKCRRTDYLWGKEIKYGDGKNSYYIRLANKNFGKWVGKVHEVWTIKGRVDSLQATLKHYPHQTLSEFLEEINNYSTLRANELYSQGERSSWLHSILFAKGKFIHNYIIAGGFLDGVPGVVRACMMSFYSFLTRAKLFLLWQKNQEL
jgi:glycosyltransferase involved in cell wall biosynthesis